MLLLIAGILVLIAGIKVYLWWLRKNDDYWEKRGLPHQPRVGLYTFLKLMTSRPMHELFLEAYKKHGRIYGDFQFRRPILSVSDPDLLRDILVKDFHIFNYRMEDTFGDPMLDTMVTVAKGEDWKRIRTVISPAFTSKRMRQMANIINECSQTVVKTFKKYSDEEKEIECNEIFGAFTIDVIASSAFATKIDSHNDPDNIFVRHAKKAFMANSMYQIAVFFLMPRWIVKRFRLGILHTIDFFKDVVLEVIKERKNTGKKYNDFLQLLLDAQEEFAKENKEIEKSNEQEDETDQFGSVMSNGISSRLIYNKLNEDELIAQCILFFIVGYETTAATLAFVAYFLALNPSCQEKLIKEVDEAFQKTEELTYDVIREMKYLDCFVTETLRMYPSLSRGERIAVEDYKLRKTDIVIEKGVGIAFNIHSMHHDPEYFVNPEKFDPERFKPENISHPQYAYLPFGAGPRNCLGMRFALMEIKLGITNILRYYRFKKGPNTKVPLDFKTGFFVGAKAIHLLVERRNKKENETQS